MAGPTGTGEAVPGLVVGDGPLTLAALRAFEGDDRRVSLCEAAWARIDAGRAQVEAALAAGAPAYGINTGLGTLSRRSVAGPDLAEMQLRVLRSNAAGTGPAMSDSVVRRMMLLKLAGFASGRSGVRRETAGTLAAMIDAGILPCIPSKGSVGASGDLAPLAHLGLAMTGEGDVRRGGVTLPARDALARAGIAPLAPEAKEALSLVNGTQASTALALEGLFALERGFAAAVVAGALSLEAALGREGAFDPRLHEARGQRGQVVLAAQYRALIEGSGLRERAAREGRMQDPYCLRCQPQVMGACLDQMRHAAGVLEREANAVTDNPLVFAEEGAILYGGNFHAEPVGLAADGLALAICEVGAMSERRTALLTDEAVSGLPAFLAADSGIDSGFMVAQVTAAALASENKALAHPGSADSIPTTGNFEDFVSMATYAARRLTEMTENLMGIVAVELLAAAQGLEFRRPDRSSPLLERAFAAIRELVPAYDRDRYFAPELETIRQMVVAGWFLDLLPDSMALFGPDFGFSNTNE